MEKPAEQALQAYTSRRGGYGNKGGQRGRNRGKDQRKGNFKNSQYTDQERFESDHGEQSSRRGEYQRWQGNKKKVDKKKLECFNCDKIGHFSSEYCEPSNDDMWYIDSGCSNHMTGNRNWLGNFDDNRKNNVRLADSRLIQAEGTTDVLISRNDERNVLIADVLYVPNMKSNLLSLGQLVEKGFSLQMHQGILEIFYAENKKILRVPLAQNMTFQVSLRAFETYCLSATSQTEES
ncbi:PREDICTED: uncharacterized protein LOC109356158 [Lupinus angustifolius]|uniref:uncharacterized protein LOC109356158 n=1 Tax=Lupinus angustifolius TaxID=3871 RepID=UPI00092F8EA2|nr:PREDICTED: uncharacterized protein LOC109356158 [Lupinus angustifolius]